MIPIPLQNEQDVNAFFYERMGGMTVPLRNASSVILKHFIEKTPMASGQRKLGNDEVISLISQTPRC